MFVRVQACCELCGQIVARVDEHDRCEECVLRAERLADELLVRLEELVAWGIDAGLTEAQLREAFELSLADEAGELSELSLSRHPAQGQERGTWEVDPQSAWLDHTSEALPNRIRRLRQAKAISAEDLAAAVGVSVASLALWEHTPEVPQEIAERLAGILGVSVPHLMKTDVEWLRN